MGVQKKIGRGLGTILHACGQDYGDARSICITILQWQSLKWLRSKRQKKEPTLAVWPARYALSRILLNHTEIFKIDVKTSGCCNQTMVIGASKQTSITVRLRLQHLSLLEILISHIWVISFATKRHTAKSSSLDYVPVDRHTRPVKKTSAQLNLTPHFSSIGPDKCGRL